MNKSEIAALIRKGDPQSFRIDPTQKVEYQQRALAEISRETKKATGRKRRQDER
jgi:hypothetical protein